MNTAARRMISAAGATGSQGRAAESEPALDGCYRPVAAGRSFDRAAEPSCDPGNASATGIDGGIESIQSICREMHVHGEACILLTGSAPGFLPARYHPAYRAGRPNVNSFSWLLRGELKGTDVTAICVVPVVADEDYFERPEEIGARVAADVSSAWNWLQAAMAAVVVWATSTTGFDRS